MGTVYRKVWVTSTSLPVRFSHVDLEVATDRRVTTRTEYQHKAKSSGTGYYYLLHAALRHPALAVVGLALTATIPAHACTCRHISIFDHTAPTRYDTLSVFYER